MAAMCLLRSYIDYLLCISHSFMGLLTMNNDNDNDFISNLHCNTIPLNKYKNLVRNNINSYCKLYGLCSLLAVLPQPQREIENKVKCQLIACALSGGGKTSGEGE
jgi:hypothetical protein